MRAWLVRPISCPELIEERQNSIEFLMDPSFKELRLRLRASVKAMKDTEKLMTRIQNLRSTANGDSIQSRTSALDRPEIRHHIGSS